MFIKKKTQNNTPSRFYIIHTFQLIITPKRQYSFACDFIPGVKATVQMPQGSTITVNACLQQDAQCLRLQNPLLMYLMRTRQRCSPGTWKTLSVSGTPSARSGPCPLGAPARPAPQRRWSPCCPSPPGPSRSIASISAASAWHGGLKACRRAFCWRACPSLAPYIPLKYGSLPRRKSIIHKETDRLHKGTAVLSPRSKDGREHYAGIKKGHTLSGMTF